MTMGPDHQEKVFYNGVCITTMTISLLWLVDQGVTSPIRSQGDCSSLLALQNHEGHSHNIQLNSSNSNIRLAIIMV